MKIRKEVQKNPKVIGIRASDHLRNTYRENKRKWYHLQVNTEPMKSKLGYLEVVGKSPMVTNIIKNLKIFCIDYVYISFLRTKKEKINSATFSVRTANHTGDQINSATFFKNKQPFWKQINSATFFKDRKVLLWITLVLTSHLPYVLTSHLPYKSSSVQVILH